MDVCWLRYLVDVAAPYNAPGVYSNLLEALRQTCGPVFLTVFHLYEPSSEQSFFVNRSLLPRRLASILSEPSTSISDSESDAISFVLLSKDGSPSQLLSSPASLPPIVKFLAALSPSLAPSISLPPYMTQETAVPLAALLLDYPIAYVPCSPEQANFLSNVPLDVYECRLALELEPGSEQEHTLMKFSCPCAISEVDTELVPQRMQERLRRNFELRMKTLGPSENRMPRVRVLHSTKTMDRVAL
ncbi:hypothetical protein BDQ12DRAFT_468320 [Crucibulum laeve]|uniref:Uncharacterized protein n=1 Tax=Crucibulum laeve TaxID=68775 RepID=A0A5C3MI18_9AGAR|nr:hypothetical protein BDQ12DRAFT_468320 [Crucibulum laeve]